MARGRVEALKEGPSEMKTARDVAVDVVHEMIGKSAVTREMVLSLIEDRGDIGRDLRKMRDTVERAVEADRRDQRKAHAPS